MHDCHKEDNVKYNLMATIHDKRAMAVIEIIVFISVVGLDVMTMIIRSVL
jgi:hypothetical protein